MTHPESDDVKEAGGQAIRISSSTEFQERHVIGGRYEVITRLGKGGMGLVYRVNQVFLNKEFALKTIDKNCMSENSIRRFQQEARTVFSLDHPSIIAVNDFGVLEDQTPFLVMELLNGETLGDRLRRTGCLTLEQAIPIFAQVCFGLAYAHETGVVHRDIKPNNIMLLKEMPLGAEGSVKIVDFGIAKFTGHEGGEIQALTRTGEIVGSPLYMSPEQCSGFRVDHRSDIYSLGCVLFEALTGTPPFVGDNALSTMMKHQGEQAPTLKEASVGGDFPQAIEDIVATMLAKPPERRYQNIGSVAHDLGALGRGDSVSKTATAARSASREPRTVSMNSTHFYTLMFGIAAIAGVCGYLIHSFASSSSREKPVGMRDQEESKILDSSPFPKDADQYVMSLKDLKVLLQQPTPDNEFALDGRTLPDKSFALIANAHWITRLDLRFCTFSNSDLSNLAPVKLKRMDLSSSNFDDTGAKAISAGKGCSQFLVNDDTRLSAEGIGHLAKIQGLEILQISGDKISNNSLVQLSKSKELVHVEMRRIPEIADNNLVPLEKSKFRTLDLASNPIGDEGMRHLAKMNDLTVVNLSDTRVTRSGITELCKGSKTIGLIRCPKLEPKDIQLLRTEFPGVRLIESGRRE